MATVMSTAPRPPGTPAPRPPASPPTDDELLPWEDPPEQRAARAADACAHCGATLGPDWDVDRSVLRCPGSAASCAAPIHGGCADASSAALEGCGACAAARRAWCPAHFLEATVPCAGCGGDRHVRQACARRGPDGQWSCGAHHHAGQTGAASSQAVENQGPFVRPGQRIADPALYGFVFATRSELAVAHALERRRLWWTALIPVRVNDDEGRRTREIDFLVITGGVPGILELDGAPHRGRAAEDHARDRASKRAGIWVVERVPSAEALRDPDYVVGRFVAMLRAYAHRAA